MVAFVHAAQVVGSRAAARNLNLICDLRDVLIGRAPAASPSRRGTVSQLGITVVQERQRSSDRPLTIGPSLERRNVMGQSEPPSTRSASRPRLFRIGKDSHGNWVVQDQQGLCGGLFVNRAEALKFAMFENGNRPQAVIMVPGVLELDMSAKYSTDQRSTANPQASLQRVA
jgi:hypothetical protein